MGASGRIESAPEEKVSGKPGRACSICVHPQLAEIQRDVVKGIPLEQVCAGYTGIKKSALGRHMLAHTGRGPARRGSGIRTSKGAASKSHPDGRCESCGGLTTLLESESLDGKALIWRAEKLLHLAEKIALEAKDAGDARLCLIALDRAQKSLDTLLRVSGLLKPDQTIIDNRSVTVNYGSWPSASLVAVELFHNRLGEGATIAEAIEAVQCLQSETPELAPGRSDKGEAA